MCQFIDTRAIYDWLQACSCSLPYWTSFLSETAASSALAGRYEKFRQIGSANRAQTGLLPSGMYTGLPPVALVPVLAPARPAAPVLMFTTSKSSSYFRARSVPVFEGETPYVFTSFFFKIFLDYSKWLKILLPTLHLTLNILNLELKYTSLDSL